MTLRKSNKDKDRGRWWKLEHESPRQQKKENDITLQ